jgi:hypothetical protein
MILAISFFPLILGVFGGSLGHSMAEQLLLPFEISIEKPKLFSSSFDLLMASK